MQTNEHVDLAAWLTAVWGEEEVCARAVMDRSEPWKGEWVNDENLALRTRNGWMLASHGGKPFAFGLLDHIVRHDPASVLARIAADKEILRLHSGDNDEACQSYAGNWIYEPCETLRLLASPYADREGFRSEWLVERQGLEQ
jgi:hypothetical protein